MNPRVYQTVRDKREWQEPAAPAEAATEKAIGSKGWYTRGYLPHFDKPGTIQMVTFRLDDALPASRRHEWEALLAIEEDWIFSSAHPKWRWTTGDGLTRYHGAVLIHGTKPT